MPKKRHNFFSSFSIRRISVFLSCEKPKRCKSPCTTRNRARSKSDFAVSLFTYISPKEVLPERWGGKPAGSGKASTSTRPLGFFLAYFSFKKAIFLPSNRKTGAEHLFFRSFLSAILAKKLSFFSKKEIGRLSFGIRKS